MIRLIHRDPLFEKQLDALRKGNRKAQIAAREVDEIIARLVQERRIPDCLHETTKSGEQRLKNCLKYDLGCGYRLITLREEDCLHIAFIGTHDECDRWLVNKKRLQPILWKSRSVTIEVPEPSLSSDEPPFEDSDAFLTDPSEDFPPIEEKYLRMVFRGLIERSAEHPIPETETHSCDHHPL
uniref:Uncharacterized protein n=1 Tax=Desulfatirhabdium butyrativorans TaxID=340467 RepID=A0A7C4RT08_9BACT